MINVTISGVNANLEFVYDGRKTTVMLTQYRGTHILGMASVVRHFKDQNVKEVARKQAIRRLLYKMNIPRNERTNVWAAYHNRSNVTNNANMVATI